MLRISVLLTLVVLTAPAAAQGLAPLPTFPTIDPIRPSDVLDAAEPATGPTTKLLQELLECRQAVRMHISWSTGEPTASRDRAVAFVSPAAVVTGTSLLQVPIVETTTETVWQATGPLSFLEPVTREVTQVVGYESRVQQITRNLDIAVAVDYRETHLNWTPHREAYFLSLPAGLPLVASGEGQIVDVCDPATAIGTHLPDVCKGVQWCSLAAREDGWYAWIVDARVRPATDEDVQGLPFADAEGFMVGSQAVWPLIAGQVDAIVAAAQDAAQQLPEHPETPRPDRPGRPDKPGVPGKEDVPDMPASHGAGGAAGGGGGAVGSTNGGAGAGSGSAPLATLSSVVHVPPSTAAFLVVAVLGVVALLALAVVGVRRLRR